MPILGDLPQAAQVAVRLGGHTTSRRAPTLFPRRGTGTGWPRHSLVRHTRLNGMASADGAAAAGGADGGAADAAAAAAGVGGDGPATAAVVAAAAAGSAGVAAAAAAAASLSPEAGGSHRQVFFFLLRRHLPRVLRGGPLPSPAFTKRATACDSCYTRLTRRAVEKNCG